MWNRLRDCHPQFQLTKSTSRNPRSTVGTITEIYDYYRLLFARIGASLSKLRKPITTQTVDHY